MLLIVAHLPKGILVVHTRPLLYRRFWRIGTRMASMQAFVGFIILCPS